jgi:DNA polymerase-3 subunit alpha
MDIETSAPRLADAPATPPWKKEEIMAFEKELLGFYVSGHPLDNYRSVYDEKSIRRIADLESNNDPKKQVRCAGLLSRVEVKYTKKDNKPFATFVLEDYTGTVEVIAWNEAYVKCKDIIADGNVVDVKAKADKDSRTESMRLLVNEMKPLKPGKVSPAPPANGASAEATPLVLMLDSTRHTNSDLDEISRIISAHPGRMPVQLQIRTRTGAWATLKTGPDFNVSADVTLLKELAPWMG